MEQAVNFCPVLILPLHTFASSALARTTLHHFRDFDHTLYRQVWTTVPLWKERLLDNPYLQFTVGVLLPRFNVFHG